MGRALFVPDIAITDGVWLDARAYGSSLNDTTLQAAIAAIGSDQQLLMIAPGTWTIDTDLTVPANITLLIPRGAVFSVASGKTVVIAGEVQAGVYQIFSGAGDVKFYGYNAQLSLPSQTGTTFGYAAWYGLSVSASAATNAAALNAAFNAGLDEVTIHAGKFYVDETVTIDTVAGLYIHGLGEWSTVLLWDGAAGDDFIYIYNCREICIEKMTIAGKDGTGNECGSCIKSVVDSAALVEGQWGVTRNCFRDLNLAYGEYGIYYTYLAADQNNEHGYFERVFCDYQSFAGFRFDGYNCLNNTLIACQTILSPYGIYSDGGTFRMYGGGFHYHDVAIKVDHPNAGLLIDGCDSEGCVAILSTTVASSGSIIQFSNCRIDCSLMDANRRMFDMRWAGPLILRGNYIFNFNTPGPTGLVYSYCPDQLSVIMEGNYFQGPDSIDESRFEVGYAPLGGSYYHLVDLRMKNNVVVEGGISGGKHKVLVETGSKILGNTSAGCASGSVAGKAKTTNSFSFVLNGKIYSHTAADNLFDLTGVTTDADEYMKILLCLNSGGSPYLIYGPIAASQAAAQLPICHWEWIPVGIVEIGPNYAGGDLSGNTFHDIIS